MSWNKVKDTFDVNFQVPDQLAAKRGMLKFLASIYSPVGIISPVTLLAEDMYREVCDLKLSWDQRLLEDPMKWWKKWIKSLPHQQIEVPRSIPMYNEKIAFMRNLPFKFLQRQFKVSMPCSICCCGSANRKKSRIANIKE